MFDNSFLAAEGKVNWSFQIQLYLSVRDGQTQVKDDEKSASLQLPSCACVEQVNRSILCSGVLMMCNDEF